MKKILLMATMLATLTACEHYELIDEPTNDKGEIVASKAFTFHLKGDFTTSFDEMTRAAVRLENDNTAGITDIWVLDYQDGKLVQQVHQTSSDADFGHPQMNLTYGHHDVKFIAAKGTEASLTASAISWGRVKDTFVLDYPVDVAASTNGNRAPELKRVISGLKVVMTDAIPTNAKTITLTLGKRSQSLTLPGLSALPYSESSADIDCSSNIGVKGASVAIYTLAGDEEWTSTASIVAKDAQGKVITSVELPDVVLRKNRMTTLTGEVFNRTSGFSVAIDSEWDEDLTGEF